MDMALAAPHGLTNRELFFIVGGAGVVSLSAVAKQLQAMGLERLDDAQQTRLVKLLVLAIIAEKVLPFLQDTYQEGVEDVQVVFRLLQSDLNGEPIPEQAWARRRDNLQRHTHHCTQEQWHAIAFRLRAVAVAIPHELQKVSWLSQMIEYLLTANRYWGPKGVKSAEGWIVDTVSKLFIEAVKA